MNPLIAVLLVLAIACAALVAASVQSRVGVLVAAGVLMSALWAWRAQRNEVSRSLTGLALRWAGVMGGALAFGLLALRGTWYGDSAGTAESWAHVVRHAALGGAIVAGSVAASDSADVSDILDAATQRLHIPYVWTEIALCGVTTWVHLAHTITVTKAAARLRFVRPHSRLRNRAAPVAAFIGSIFPLCVDAVRFAGELTQTLITRGLGIRSSRTCLREFPWRLRDTVAVVGLLLTPLLTAVA